MNHTTPSVDFFERLLSDLAAEPDEPLDPEDLERMRSFLAKQSANKCWASVNGVFTPCEEAVPKLASSCYTAEISPDMRIFFRVSAVSIDELVPLPDSATEEVLEHVREFWKRQTRFRELGFLWKRGILLWGPPGGGKSSTVQLVCQELLRNEAVCLIAENPQIDTMALMALRKIEPERPVVVIMEDLDAIINKHGEAPVLALLDGPMQVDNVIFIATTNYPEKLDSRIVNRPSRFDVIRYIDFPSAAARTEFFKRKNPTLSLEDLKTWVDQTDKLSIAHLKELIVLVEIFGVPLKEAVDRLRDMAKKLSSSDTFGSKSGQYL